MNKWADYLISEVRYGKNHLIEEVKFHTDDEGVISEPKMVGRLQISHNVKNGKTYRTIFHSLNGWKPGDLVNVLRVSVVKLEFRFLNSNFIVGLTSIFLWMMLVE